MDLFLKRPNPRVKGKEKPKKPMARKVKMQRRERKVEEGSLGSSWR
jgi:hypothetical protein